MASRTRRPDRAVYVPRAKRSQTTPPSSEQGRKSIKSKSQSIDENNSSEDNFEESSSPDSSSAVKIDRISDSCGSDEYKNIEDLLHFEDNMADTKKSSVEISVGTEKTKKVDKMSHKANRKNMTKSSGSKVLKVESPKEVEHANYDQTAVNKVDDDWDTL